MRRAQFVITGQDGRPIPGAALMINEILALAAPPYYFPEVFLDEARTIQAPNPIIADSDGYFPPLFFGNDSEAK